MKSLIINLSTIVLAFSSVAARQAITNDQGQGELKTALASPAYCAANQDVGKLSMVVTNYGTLGASYARSLYDCFTGESLTSVQFPKGSNSTYLYGAAIWIGAVIDEDTLVSTGQDGWSVTGAEFHPDELPHGNMIYRSTLDQSSPAAVGAVSHEDYIAVFTDTSDRGGNAPLNLEITQMSYAWAHPIAEDLVLFELEIKNIGSSQLSNVYFGLYVDGDVYQGRATGGGSQDDVTGFIPTANSESICGTQVDINTAWIADNDGNLGLPSYAQVRHVTGTHLINFASNPTRMSYNWWVSNGDPTIDFGPMTYEKYRDLGTGGYGTPEGDRNKYWYLSNGEVDYDQPLTATIGPDDSIWLPPNPTLIYQGISSGFDTRYLLSFGPVDLAPGQTVPLAYAYVAGENWHTVPDNAKYLPDNPDQYYANLNMSDLIENSLRADWVYDNPGVDNDSDGYAGTYEICDGDTIWVTGDGVPDFKAAHPPAAPYVRVLPLNGGVRVNWNGYASETSYDPLNRVHDFEGFNIYLSTGEGAIDYALLATYDLLDYFRIWWDHTRNEWQLLPDRWTDEALRCRFAPGGCADASFDLNAVDRLNPIRDPLSDSIFYFQPISCNTAELGVETPIKKSFPAAPKPPYEHPSDVPPDSADMYLTIDGYFKYYEYEYTIDNLLSDQPYRVAVTAFDYGAPLEEFTPMESPIVATSTQFTPSSSADCCVGPRGNADYDSQDIVDVGDIASLVEFLFLGGNEPLCPSEANADGDMGGIIDMGDLTVLVQFLFLNGDAPDICD